MKQSSDKVAALVQIKVTVPIVVSLTEDRVADRLEDRACDFCLQLLPDVQGPRSLRLESPVGHFFLR